MLFFHIGHAEFVIETENGTRIVTDPYDAGCGYPIQPVKADIALISHHHHDHDAVDNVTGNPTVIEHAGVFAPCQGISVTALDGYHDEEKGAKRGKTLLFLIEAEGLRVVHMGDLGDNLNMEQQDRLRNPDVLMIPVGGYFTINGKQAKRIADSLNAKIILPMHYKTEYNADWPISGPDEFLEEYKEREICRDCEALRVTKEDMECQPKVVLFQQPLKRRLV